MNYFGMISPRLIILLLLAVSGIILTIIALIDILKSKFEGNNKIVWVLVVLFINLFGAILYFTIGRKQKLTN
jgi:heme/copper-type cytochrome/quinol oxidase subunit 4